MVLTLPQSPTLPVSAPSLGVPQHSLPLSPLHHIGLHARTAYPLHTSPACTLSTHAGLPLPPTPRAPVLNHAFPPILCAHLGRGPGLSTTSGAPPLSPFLGVPRPPLLCCPAGLPSCFCSGVLPRGRADLTPSRLGHHFPLYIPGDTRRCACSTSQA